MQNKLTYQTCEFIHLALFLFGVVIVRQALRRSLFPLTGFRGKCFEGHKCYRYVPVTSRLICLEILFHNMFHVTLDSPLLMTEIQISHLQALDGHKSPGDSGSQRDSSSDIYANSSKEGLLTLRQLGTDKNKVCLQTCALN